MQKYLVKLILPKHIFPTIKEIIKSNKKFLQDFINCNNYPIAYRQYKDKFIVYYTYDEKNLKSFKKNNFIFYYYDYIPDEKIPDIF